MKYMRSPFIRATKLQHFIDDLKQNYPDIEIIYKEPNESELAKATGRLVKIFSVSLCNEYEVQGKKKFNILIVGQKT